MPSIGQELEETRTARWYRAARNAQRAKAWDERARCFAALSTVLSDAVAREAKAPDGPGQSIRLPGILTIVARSAHFASAEPVYKRWRARQDGQPVTRWAGMDPTVKPVAAFISEAKIAAFWPYREGVVKIADAFDMTLTEFALAYLRVLASWAGEHPLLAACHPAGPPPCVAEDMAVLAGRLAVSDGARRGARLGEVAANVVAAALADPGITSADAAGAAAAEVGSLLAEPANSIAERVSDSVAELTERIAADDHVIGMAQATRLLAALRQLDAMLSGVTGGRR